MARRGGRRGICRFHCARPRSGVAYRGLSAHRLCVLALVERTGPPIADLREREAAVAGAIAGAVIVTVPVTLTACWPSIQTGRRSALPSPPAARFIRPIC